MLKHSYHSTGGGTSLLSRSSFSKAFFVLLILLLSTNTLFSTSLKWSWTGNDNSSKYFRYKLNNNDWTIVDSTINSVTLKREKLKDTLYVESSIDGISWSDTAIGEYSHSNLALKANLAPYSLAVYDFYNGHQIKDAKAITHTLYGLSTSIELDWTLFDRITIYPEFGYSLEIKKETIIPNQKNVHYIKAGAGIDYKSYLTADDSFSIGISVGALWQINNNKRNVTPYYSARLIYERELSEHFILGLSSKASIAHLKTDEKLLDSLTFLIDPLSISLSYVF